MKRKVALRKLRRPCFTCNCSFAKGAVYYKHRLVFNLDDKVYAHEHLICPVCHYKQNHRKQRIERLIATNTCKHPLRNMIYTLIPGETVVREPSHEECLVCNQII